MIGVERVFSKVGQLLFISTSHKSTAILSSVNKCTPAPFVTSVRFNSNRASICRVGRLQYLRQYPTTVVNPGGSTFSIRYKEPRQIIKFPIDITRLSEPEKRKHLEKRKPKTKVTLEEDFDDIEFDSSKYLKLVKK